MEIWKELPTPAEIAVYEISSYGQVRTRRYGRGEWKILSQFPDRGGYMRLTIARRHTTVHRLVLQAFVGPCPDGLQCAHRDGDRKNNRLENLRWATPTSNNNDKLWHGTDQRGENCYIAKLTEDNVRYIRRALDDGTETFRGLARRFGVHLSTIADVRYGRTWVATV